MQTWCKHKRRRSVLAIGPLLVMLRAAVTSRSSVSAWVAPSPRVAVETRSGRTADDLPAGAADASHDSETLQLSYSHVHFHCDALRSLEDYKALEDKLNRIGDPAQNSIDYLQQRWQDVNDGVAPSPEDYSPVDQDLVEQLLVGLGWRITAAYSGPATQTFVVSSPDAQGAQFVITAPHHPSGEKMEGASDVYSHFDRPALEQFAACNSGRQGVAALGFETGPGGVEKIRRRYEEHHPELLVAKSPQHYGDSNVLEVYAYYLPSRHGEVADKGTILRFVERPQREDAEGPDFALPGLESVPAAFQKHTQPAYSDHWVSNVFDRQGFLDTLEETLGFTPKVDFNAGVVAAGEAQIESTVTGNDPGLALSKGQALTDKRQIYLPINNHLTDVGHVHLFLKELGQGVQHIATRVPDLGSLIQHANDQRKALGSGLSFLPIPQSYYGYLTAERLSKDAGIDISTAEEVFASLVSSKIVDASNNVKLEASLQQVMDALPADTPEEVAQHVLRARYNNLHALLGDSLTEEMYMKIVRNHILVDVQGEDVLMQIFTSKVLQRSGGEEAPFLEFIQRLCSVRSDTDSTHSDIMRPGCGGFGIRNFLTLFISIELSKASQAKAEAEAAGNAEAASIASRTLEALMAQLEESNPILNTISEAMTAEGKALQQGDLEQVEVWSAKKAAASEALQALSARYAELTAEIRTGGSAR